jgi:hypothetical protein
LQMAINFKNDGQVTQNDLWKWTPQHISKIVEKIRQLMILIQHLKK